MDDHLHMASSVWKKITERYQSIDADNLRLIITLDDPTFLTKPLTYSKLFTRSTGGGRDGDAEGILGKTARLLGEPHPFVSTEAAERFNTVLLECYEAQLTWRTGS